MSDHEVHRVDEMVQAMWRELEALPEQARAYAAARVLRMGYEIMPPACRSLIPTMIDGLKDAVA